MEGELNVRLPERERKAAGQHVIPPVLFRLGEQTLTKLLASLLRDIRNEKHSDAMVRATDCVRLKEGSMPLMQLPLWILFNFVSYEGSRFPRAALLDTGSRE